MKFVTLIPTHYNDGTPVPEALRERLIRALYKPFRAMTRDDGVKGYWIDQEDGTEYADESTRISIECDRSRLREAMQRVLRVGRRLKQKAMYFEVVGYDGTQILRVVQEPM